MICASIAHTTQIVEVLQTHVGLIELRLDLIRKDPRELYAQIPADMKTIATCRPGVYTEEERIVLLKTSLDLGASFIDIEIDSPQETLSQIFDHSQNCAADVIVSYHNFEFTPDRAEMVKIMSSCYAVGGTIAKIATEVNSMDDTRNLLSLYDLAGKKVVIGMGSMGRIIRIMAPYVGAEFTFAATDQGGETAPGQLSVSQLNELYKVIDRS